MIVDNTAITLKNISFTYHKRAPLFTNFNLSIPKEQLTAFTGSSGCGKSTLLYIISGLLRPKNGKIDINGTKILNLTDSQSSLFRATHIGFVFQDFVLDPRRSILDSVLEPCIYARKSKDLYTERANQLLDSLGVFAPKTATPLEISGGQAQRVALARAILLNPSVILADEPTGNLDQESTQIVLDTLLELSKKGTTVIIATHDTRVTEYAHNIVRVRHAS